MLSAAKHPGPKATKFLIKNLRATLPDASLCSAVAPLKPGQKIVFEDMIHYTMVKISTFNGVTHPSIAIWRPDGRLDVVRKFGYNDYKKRLS